MARNGDKLASIHLQRKAAQRLSFHQIGTKDLAHRLHIDHENPSRIVSAELSFGFATLLPWPFLTGQQESFPRTASAFYCGQPLGRKSFCRICRMGAEER